MQFLKKVAIIGVGNLGQAILEGILESKTHSAEEIIASKRNIKTLEKYQQKGVTITHNNAEAVAQAEWIILAIKPFQLKSVLEEIKPQLTEQHKLISVVTGIFLQEIQITIGLDIPIFRAMPNTAIAIKESITCISSIHADEQDQAWVSNLFNQLGKSVLIEEKLMDAATVLGACGIAFALRYIRACTQGGIQIGFDAKTASLIVEQTVKGAAQLLLERGNHPEEEIDKVTTPKGCTIAGLNQMEHQGFSSSLIKGITTSYEAI